LNQGEKLRPTFSAKKKQDSLAGMGQKQPASNSKPVEAAGIS
jgi:hypothetical protein